MKRSHSLLTLVLLIACRPGIWPAPAAAQVPVVASGSVSAGSKATEERLFLRLRHHHHHHHHNRHHRHCLAFHRPPIYGALSLLKAHRDIHSFVDHHLVR